MSLTFGEKIKEARKQKNLTQKQLADLIGAAHNSISDWENNKNKPDPDTIELLCGALKITPNYLLASTEDDFSPKEKLLIKKYRLISTHSPDGAVVVDTVLDREYAIAEKLREQKEQLEKARKMDMEVAEEIIPKRILAYAYYGKIAAAGTSVEFSGMTEGIKSYPENDININADYVIGVSGDSMEPEYYDGDIVYVQKTEHLNIGDIGIFQKGNHIYIKKAGEDGLISLNPNYPPITTDGERIIVLGKVIGKAES